MSRMCRAIGCALVVLCVASGAPGQEWHVSHLPLRVAIAVAPQIELPAGWPVEMRLDLDRLVGEVKAPALTEGKMATRLVEVDKDGATLREVACQFDADPGPATCGEIVWLLDGNTPAERTRHFVLYFGPQTGEPGPVTERAALSVEPSKTTENSYWVDTGVMRVELVPNADRGAPCRDLIHSWLHSDEEFDIAHKSLSILSNPCWMHGPEGARQYGTWPFRWRLVGKQIGPLRARFTYQCEHSYKKHDEQVPFALMTRRVSLYAGSPVVRDEQQWELRSDAPGVVMMEESYFESTETFKGFGRERDLAFFSRGPYMFVHALSTLDERLYSHHFSSRPRPGAEGQCLTIDSIDFGDLRAGQHLDYTVYQLYGKRGEDSAREFVRRWHGLLMTPPISRCVSVQQKGSAAISVLPAPRTPRPGPAVAAQPGPPEVVDPVWRPQRDHPLVIPRPKELKWTEGVFRLKPNTRIIISDQAGERGRFGARLLQEELAGLYGLDAQVEVGGQVADARDAIVIGAIPANPALADLCRRHSLSASEAEGYALEVSSDLVLVGGADEAGTFYGVQTLLQLLTLDEGGAVVIPGVVIQDWPDLKIRGFHLCFQAGRPDLDMVKRLIRYCIARCKMNTLILEVEGGVKFDSHPEIAAPDALTKEELRDVVLYAKQHGLDVIPQIQSLGHCNYWLFRGGQHKELAETPDKPYDYCPSNPDVYRLLFELYEELLPIFEPRYFHIGHDEMRDLGVCPRCKGKAPHELLAGDVIKLHDFFAARDIRIMMWADTLLESRNGGPPRDLHRALDLLPKDIILCDWNYAGAKQYPTVQHLRDSGFDVIVTPWYNPTNNAFIAKAAQEADTLGLIGSTWCGVRPPLPKYFGGLLLSAEYAWSVGVPALEELGYRPLPRLARQAAAQPVERGTKGVLLDIAPFCNRGFTDPGDGINQGNGWLGLGKDYDLSALQTGKQWLGGMLFDVVDPKRNQGASCIVLRGSHRFTSDERFPTEVTGIPVGHKLSSLTFLHTCGWPVTAGEKIGSYRVHYEDGTVEDAPVLYGKDVLEWNHRRPDDVTEAEIAWTGETKAKAPACVFAWTWRNPHPEKVIASLDIVSSGTAASAIMLAITGRQVRG